jgi:mono/diheme cytochrome c family protein
MWKMRAKPRTVAIAIASWILTALSLAPLPANAAGLNADGAGEYQQYCAACHGADGRGDGPMAAVLIRRPSDLTALSKNNGDSFPETVVYQVIDGRRTVQFHGSTQMPIWGERFQGDNGDEQAVGARINALVEFLITIQAKGGF